MLRTHGPTKEYSLVGVCAKHLKLELAEEMLPSSRRDRIGEPRSTPQLMRCSRRRGGPIRTQRGRSVWPKRVAEGPKRVPACNAVEYSPAYAWHNTV